ncbi:MAG: hypothetical protein JO233_08165, partial [Candidatus Eremiobacteraeota bacterium]|nr:hypothetical protein [Candidatus Eremiobacteraeota bacterium]
DALARALELSAWRSELVVQPIWELLSGQTALRIEGHAERVPQITYHGVQE